MLRDGAATDREWASLRSLRAQLGLTEADAQAIEAEVERLLQVDDPRTGSVPS